jgi:hypothetical protein
MSTKFAKRSFAGRKSQDKGDRLPTSETNSPFYFYHSPLSWDYIKTGEDTYELLPKLVGMPQQAGANGMGMRIGGGVDDGRTITNLEREQDCVVLPMDLEYDGIEGYMDTYLNQNGSPLYKDRWTSPKKIGSKLMWKTDDEGFNTFKKWLVTEGYIAPPDEVIVEGLKERYQRRIDKRIVTAQNNPEIAAQKAMYEKMYDGIEPAYQALLKPKKGGKK